MSEYNTSDWGVEITINKLIAQIESSNCQGAIRFENGLYQKLINNPAKQNKPILFAAMKANNCSLETAIGVYCTSYGLYQIMGFNLYGSLHFEESVWSFMCSKEIQDHVFKQFCNRFAIPDLSVEKLLDKKTRERFAYLYNGPGNVEAYSEKILKTIQQMKGQKHA